MSDATLNLFAFAAAMLLAAAIIGIVYVETHCHICGRRLVRRLSGYSDDEGHWSVWRCSKCDRRFKYQQRGYRK